MLRPLLLLLVAYASRLCLGDQSASPDTLCGQFDFYNSTAVPYAYNTNAWGDDGTGHSCMTLLPGTDNSTFSVQYAWSGDPSTVKAFPYLKLSPSRLPVQLWNASALELAVNYSTTVDGTASLSATAQAAALAESALKANVAVDMFLSDNITNSTGLNPPIEIMIWLWYTSTILPLGWDSSTPQIDTVNIPSVGNFSLYQGYNIQQQHVFSWLIDRNVTEVPLTDFSPLLKYIWHKGYLSGALYLGQIEFGTEVMHAGQNTTFEAVNPFLKIYRQGDSDDPNKPVTGTSTTSATAAPTATKSASPSATTSSGAQSLIRTRSSWWSIPLAAMVLMST